MGGRGGFGEFVKGVVVLGEAKKGPSQTSRWSWRSVKASTLEAVGVGHPLPIPEEPSSVEPKCLSGLLPEAAKTPGADRVPVSCRGVDIACGCNLETAAAGGAVGGVVHWQNSSSGWHSASPGWPWGPSEPRTHRKRLRSTDGEHLPAASTPQKT